MNNILSSIKLDYYIVRSTSLRILVFVIGIATLAGVISSNPPLIIFIISMTSGFFMGGVFAVVEKNNLDKLYGILPVEKQQIVIGRYAFTLIIGILSQVLAAVLAFFVSFILGLKFSCLAFTAWACGSFFLFCLLASIQFPIYFRYDFSKVSAIANMPIIILFISCSALIRKRPELFSQTVNCFTHRQYTIWLIGIVGGLLLLGISMFLSCVLYKNHDL
jgi:hypothetical protein